MPSFNQSFGFATSPFQEYVAENEPHIDAYAVKPPYFVHVSERAEKSSSILLFGRRGAGKSATRLTVYKELWKQVEQGKSIPFPVNLIDFSSIIKDGVKSVNQATYVRQLGFAFLEALLVWLGSLEDDERENYVGGMNDQESALVIGLLTSFYFNVPDLQRQISTGNAIRLLNQAWHSKAKLWMQKNWSGLTTVVAALAAALLKKHAGTAGSEEVAIKSMLDALGKGGVGNDLTVAILQKFVQCAQIFGFTGIVVLADKIDETSETATSVENTANVVIPLLSQVQLMEIDGLGWIFFLWDKVKDFIGGHNSPVRLDKIAHSNVEWEPKFLAEMINSRLIYFSAGKIKSPIDFLSREMNESEVISNLSRVAMNSPRELIRLLDTVIREHDQINSENLQAVCLNSESIEIGLDKYVLEAVNRFADEKVVNQFIKLDLLRFTNKEVQGAFRVGPNPARTRIQNWVDAGLVKQTGTRAAEGDGGGKPNNEYSILDSRIERIVQRKLITVSEDVAEEPETDEDARAE